MSTGTGTIKDEHIRESLLTAIEEKLMRRMKEQFQQNQAEMETLKRTQEELKQGKAKLDNILSRLEKEQASKKHWKSLHFLFVGLLLFIILFICSL